MQNLRASGATPAIVLVPIAANGDSDSGSPLRRMVLLHDPDVGGGWLVSEERLEARLKHVANITPKLFYGPELAVSLSGS